jgi:plastocyanin
MGDAKATEEIGMRRKLSWLMFLGVVIVFGRVLQAESWRATAGGQSDDKSVQALAFLPNEMWIHAGDTVTWTFSSDEAHSITFLKTGQTRPTFAVGCAGAPLPAGVTPDGSAYDGFTCVNSGLVTNIGTTYTVLFSKAGNYTLLCLLHSNQSGLIHVLDKSESLPHDQDFYDQQAAAEQRALLFDRDGGLGRKFREDSPQHSHGSNNNAHQHMVVSGAGELVATPGGAQSASVMRFSQPDITVHVGETVEWASSDVSGHSVTFGDEEGITPLTPRTASIGTDSDGVPHAFISSPSDNLHSGRLAPAPQERTNLASVAGVTRYRVTFTAPGTYPYVCAFHDDLGMKGTVTVLP